MSESFPRVRKSKTLGRTDSHLTQFWTSAELRALLDVVSMRLDCTRSGYVRRAVYNQLTRDASDAELAEYRKAISTPP